MPTFLAAAGDSEVKQKLLKGFKAGRTGRTKYKVHLDGYNLLPTLKGEVEHPRKEFFYFSDDGDLTGLRYDNWKVVFAQQRETGTLNIWSEPYTFTRIPWLFNLRTDPYERASITSNTYWDWYLDRSFLLLPAVAYVAEYLETFKEYPPRQEAATFTINRVLESLTPPGQ